MAKGVYIVFEGVVGTGKTTQSKRLVEALKAEHPDREIVWTREPGGSEIAEAIRTVVQATPFGEAMDPICEAYLYASARAQSLRAVVKPVLERGGIVIADRSFATSVAWQGEARGIGLDAVLKINESAIEDCLPDAIIEIDLDPAIGLQRTFDAKGDKFESMPVEFFEACRRGYKTLSEHPRFAPIWHRVSGEGSVEEVAGRVGEIVDKSISRLVD